MAYESSFNQITKEVCIGLFITVSELLGLISHHIDVQIPVRINKLLNYESNPDAARAEIRQINSDIATAKQCISDMELAARSSDPVNRKALGDKIRIYKGSMTSIQKDLSEAEARFNRAALIPDRDNSSSLNFTASQGQRERMAESTQRLNQGTDMLLEADRQIAGMQEVGISIMTELNRNRETLARIHGNASEASGTLDTAKRILRNMSRREIHTKIALGAFSVFLIGIIAVVSHQITQLLSFS